MLAVALGSSCCAVMASYLSAHISMGLGETIREPDLPHRFDFSSEGVRQDRHAPP